MTLAPQQSPRQQSLGLRLQSRGKTVSLRDVRAYLGDLDDWELQALLDDGRLSWAINVASADADKRAVYEGLYKAHRLNTCRGAAFRRWLLQNRDKPTWAEVMNGSQP
jgi:hypothetical protein